MQPENRKYIDFFQRNTSNSTSRLTSQRSLHGGNLRFDCGFVALSEETSVVAPAEETTGCYDSRTATVNLCGRSSGRNLRGICYFHRASIRHSQNEKLNRTFANGEVSYGDATTFVYRRFLPAVDHLNVKSEGFTGGATGVTQNKCFRNPDVSSADASIFT